MASTPPISDDPSVEAATSPDAFVLDTTADDPFDNTFSSVGKKHHRFSHFDSQLFALGPNASPAQAKRALEAHLAETDRRMEEAGKLGTALVQQRKELEDRLKDVDKLQSEEELSDELRQKLIEVEKEYNEVARESARAFLPKSRVPSNEAASAAAMGSPFVPENRGGRRSISPSKFEAQATGSPTKLSVPNRKVRNQPSNRIHDIEFAAEISTSLITQVRNLQGLLAEKDEELRDMRGDNSKLEYELEGYQQRLKALDDSEHRYKDENWNLETQVHDLMAKDKEASDREKKLTQTLNVLTAEKNAAQRELDEIKLSHSKLTEEHAASVKHHDIEIGTAKRTMVMGESERAAMQRKIEDLTGQNQELAKAVSQSQRGRTLERESIFGMSDEDFQTAHDNTTPEQSPPPSPVKGTPRHSMLESETLKTSLAHAQRTIQSLRSNVHREKTEKMEHRRLLQEARDEIERLRNDPASSGRRARKTDSKEFKKPPRLLGGLRSARSEIFNDDPNWEDQAQLSPQAHSSPVSRDSTIIAPVAEHSDQFDTANETSDAAFETANENGAETDDFHTGAEEFSSDDVETETDSPSKRRTLKSKPPNLSWQRSHSAHSTASTEDEDAFFESETRTPTSLPPLQAKFPLRVSRGAFRRSRQPSEEPALLSSPASFVGTPQQGGQSLAAELGDFDGSDNESSMSATPSRRSIRARTATPPPAVPPLPKVVMVDSAMMTEPMPELSLLRPDRPISTNTIASRYSMGSSYNGSSVQDLDEKLAEFPAPPTSLPQRELAELVMSEMHSNGVEPLPEADVHGAELAALRAKHTDELTEKTSAHAAAIEALKQQHADERAQAEAELTSAHNQRLEALRSDHTSASSAAAAAAQATLLAEIEALKSSHAKQSDEATADMQAAHARELDLTRNEHAEQLAQKESDLKTLHVADLEKLQLAHAEEIARQKADSQAAFTSELDALKANHSKAKADDDAVHAAELAALVAAHATKVDEVKKDLSAKHATEIDNLTSQHADEINQKAQSLDSAHAEQLAALKTSHANEMDDLKNSMGASHAKELENTVTARDAAHTAAIATLTASHAHDMEKLAQDHSDKLESIRAAHAQEQGDLENAHAKEKEDLQVVHSKEKEDLQAVHSKALEDLGNQKDADHEAAINKLSDAHRKQLDDLKASHAQEKDSQENAHKTILGDFTNSSKKERDELESAHARHHEERATAHAAEIAALVESHNKKLDSQKAEHESALTKEIAALKDKHAGDIEALHAEHAAAHAEERNKFNAALAQQAESSKIEGDAAHNDKIEALKAAHAEVVESHKRESESAQKQAIEALKSTHDREMETLRSDHAVSKSKDLEDMANKHADEMNALRAEKEASTVTTLDDLANTHANELEELHQKLAATHGDELENLKKEHEANMSQRIKEMEDDHARKIDEERAALSADLAASHKANMDQKLEELAESHKRDLESQRQQHEEAKASDLAAVHTKHDDALAALTAAHELSLKQKVDELAESHARDIDALRQEGDSKHAALGVSHQSELEKINGEHESARQREVDELKSGHATSLATLRTEHQSALDQALDSLKDTHRAELAQALADLKAEHAQALESITTKHAQTLDLAKTERDNSQSEHSQQLDQLRKDNDAALSRELDALTAQHARDREAHQLDSDAARTRDLDALKAQHEQELAAQTKESATEKAALIASHAAELEALRKTLTTVPPALGFSSVSSVQTEPVDLPEIKSPRREAFIIPQDRKPLMGEQSSQTMLTGEDMNLYNRMPRPQSPESVIITTDRGEVVVTPFDDASARSPSTVRVRRSSTDSQGSVARARHRMSKSESTSAMESGAPRRPGSSSSARTTTTQDRPPLPPNHREVIEAARTSSAHGGVGTMGPPLLPASAYPRKNSRPQTPSNRPPQSPVSARGTPTPRAVPNGYADIATLPRGVVPMRSRQSSMSSFASEIDTRFNLANGMPVDAAEGQTSADKRMIKAITETMIGEYLHKYTRRVAALSHEFSNTRHKRYFWLHPYTRTLYWSDADPSEEGGQTAKSCVIDSVHVVKDHNPYPAGIHNKSIIVNGPDRAIKFTARSSVRHEMWLNALSYLLLRFEKKNNARVSEPGEADTTIDTTAASQSVDVGNQSIVSQATNGTRARVPGSISSRTSRATQRDESYVDLELDHPTLTPTQGRGIPRSSTRSRISGYWKSSALGSLRNRRAQPYELSLYESEVNDSAEELRQILERQERESDQMENVRACCDGEHDVGTLPHTVTRRGRLSGFRSSSNTHSHSHPEPSQTPAGSVRSRA